MKLLEYTEERMEPTIESDELLPADKNIKAQVKLLGNIENCGYVCGYQYPYGFVPEAGCPVHDIDPIAPGATEHTHRYHAEDEKDYICIDCGARRPKFQSGARPMRYA